MATFHECVPPVRLNEIFPLALEMVPENVEGSIVKPGTLGLVHGVVAPGLAVRVQFFESVAANFILSVNEPLLNPTTACAVTAPLASVVASAEST